MLFRILGPLQIAAGNGWACIGAPKWRALLAVLLTEQGRVVSVERLIDELWGDDPPSGARKLVSGYVLRLRRLMGDPCGLFLVTQAPGYRLMASRDDLDARQFEDLVAIGRRELAADPRRTLEVLEQALALWTGPALADVPRGPTVAAEADRLEELRLAASELRIEAGICCGHGAELVPRLRGLTAEHPLRERFWQQLMRALAESGRPAEALEAYARAREVLAEQLGADPGPGLQQLHQRILAGDRPHSANANPSPPQPQAGPVPAVIPRQLPAAVRHFTGRAEELRQLSQFLEEAAGSGGGVVISAIGGMGGVGKTALAVFWAHQVKQRFPDGQLHANLRGFDPSGSPAAPARVIREFLDAMGVPADRVPDSTDARVSLYRSLLAERRMLILLDNASDSEQVRPLLPASPACMVIVTSRNQLAGLVATEAAHSITLDALTGAEAHELLAGRLGARAVEAEPGPATELASLCAMLPLALSVAAARVTFSPGHTLRSLVADLRDVSRRLDALDAGDSASSVRAVFSWSYRQLSPLAARMFRLLGVHPGPDISVQAAVSLAGADLGQTHQILDELARANLIAEHHRGRFSFHDLLRTYAAELAHLNEHQAERLAALSRTLDHYLHTAHTADGMLQGERASIALAQPDPMVIPEEIADDEQALAWFRAESHVLLATIAQSVSARFDAHAWRLAWSISAFFNRDGRQSEWAAALDVALAAAERLDDHAARASILHELGYARHRLGRHQDALDCLRQALDLFVLLGDGVGQARVHNAFTVVLECQGMPQQALSHARRVLSLCKAAGHLLGQARALNAIGWYESELGNYAVAMSCCERALAWHRELGDVEGEAATLDSLGYMYDRVGQHDEAAACYYKAIALFGQTGDRRFQAVSLGRLGDAHLSAGHVKAARESWQEALEILADGHDPEASHLRAKLDDLDRIHPIASA